VLRFAASLEEMTPPRVINQNVPHHLRGDGEKVVPVLPLDLLLPRQTKISFVDQRRSLQRVAITLPLHVPMCNATQFVIDKRSQLIERSFVSLPPFD
jgi:hypothetical protein